MINIGLIEPDAVNRQELKNFFNLQPELVCSLSTATVAEFIEGINATHSILVVLLCLPTDVTKQIINAKVKKLKNKIPEADVILLTDHTEIDTIIAALRGGTLGYLERNTPLLEIKKVLLGVALGEAYLSPVITRKIANYFLNTTQDVDYEITTREKQIIVCLTNGLSYKMIASDLAVSLDTVRFHLRNIYKKLGVNSKTEVIAKVLKRELIL